MADDATDVAVVEQMVAFVSYLNPSTSRQEVNFLFIEEVLNDPEADGATADVLLKVLTKQLDDSKLENKCRSGLKSNTRESNP